MPGWGLGKKRSRLGTWLDREGMTQRWLQKETGLSQETIRKLVNEERGHNSSTMKKVLTALRKKDPSVKQEDFWPM